MRSVESPRCTTADRWRMPATRIGRVPATLRDRETGVDAPASNPRGFWHPVGRVLAKPKACGGRPSFVFNETSLSSET